VDAAVTGWNMPPGVTGNEDYFGPDAEEPMEVVCGRSTELNVYTDELDDAIRVLLTRYKAIIKHGRGETDDPGALARLLMAIGEVAKVVPDLPTVEAICPFGAEEWDVQIYGRGPHARVEWKCPVCGSEHTELDGTDPDREYEEKGDR
jgi:hypothetical protein